MLDSSRLSDEEASAMFEKLGIPEKTKARKAPQPSSRAASGDSEVARLLRELYRSDVGKRPSRSS